MSGTTTYEQVKDGGADLARRRRYEGCGTIYHKSSATTIADAHGCSVRPPVRWAYEPSGPPNKDIMGGGIHQQPRLSLITP